MTMRWVDHILGSDTHANRPAASSVAPRSLYSCSDHDLIYRTNTAGDAWETWADLTVTATSTTTLTNKTVNSFTNFVEADGLHIEAYNNTGSTITKGTPVYFSGYNVGQDRVEIAPADASSQATMSCIGLAEADISTASSGSVQRVGVITDVDTSSFSVGDELYVSETAGTLTATAPTGGTTVAQRVAVVVRSSAPSGILNVLEFGPDVAATAATGFVEADDGGKEELSTNATSGATPSIDLADGNVHDVTLTANATFTFTGSTASVACSFTLILRQDGTGSRTVTWPASVDWDSGSAPTLSTAASSVDVFTFLTIDNGTTWLGFVAGQGMA